MTYSTRFEEVLRQDTEGFKRTQEDTGGSETGYRRFHEVPRGSRKIQEVLRQDTAGYRRFQEDPRG